MRRSGRQWVVQAAAGALFLSACKTAPRRAPVPPPAAAAPDGGVTEVALDAGAPQAGSVIGEVAGTPLLALSAPQFAQLPRDQRLLAYEVSQAAAAGESTALDQSYRYNLEVARLLRGILSRAAVVPAPLLNGIRAFARVVWLNGGLHDPYTGRKEIPPFTAADLRAAALAAQAAGANLGLGSVVLEYALRALEGPLFDPRVDAQRTSHGGDLTESAVNHYSAVTTRDLRGLQEKYILDSRLARDDSFVVEQVIRLPAVAAALDQALPYAAPPQRAVLEPLASSLRTGEPEPFRAAELAWLEAAGPVDFFLGFIDRSADPRGRKAIFGALLGQRDDERGPLLAAVAQASAKLEAKMPWGPAQRRPASRIVAAEALLLAGASGASRPLRSFALTLPLEAGLRETAGTKTALFPAAEEAAAKLRTDPALLALSEPGLAPHLARCLPSLRLSFLALREIVGRSTGRPPQGDLQNGLGAFEEARADLTAHFLSADPLVAQLGLLSPSCQKLWPQFAATSWFASAANVPQGDRVEDDAQRARQLQIWWFTGKGAIAERQSGGRRYLAVTDPARFHAAAGELLSLLQQIATHGDGARFTDLLERHASRVDTRWREEVLQRLRAANVPLRVAILPPRLEPVVSGGKLTDAVAVPVDDLDALVLRDWEKL